MLRVLRHWEEREITVAPVWSINANWFQLPDTTYSHSTRSIRTYTSNTQFCKKKQNNPARHAAYGVFMERPWRACTYGRSTVT